MNCREVNQLLVPFLNQEIVPSEYALIQTHLAGCPACQQKLTTLSATRSRLIRSMKLQAAEATPSPQAWNRLQIRVAEVVRPSSAWPKRLASITEHKHLHSRYHFTMKTGVMSAVLVVLIMAISILTFVPSVRAQVGKLIASILPDPLGAQPGACQSVEGGAVGTGVFVWPTTQHDISGKDFNPDSPLYHPAIDIAAVKDSNVVAADTGVVVYAGWNNWGYGNMVIIDHGNGWQSLYAHLDVVKIGCGKSVVQGQLIGLAGQTGNAPFPQLHFELWQTIDGQVNQVNPHLFLP
jgi:hypothetical protein